MAAFREIAPDRELPYSSRFDVRDAGRSLLGYTAPVRDSGGRLLGRTFALRETTTERLKDEFVATVSHELRTPLASIIGNLELVLEDRRDAPDEKRHFLEVVDRSARRLLHVVGDLLLVAQVDADRLSLDLALLDAAALVRESVEASRPLADAKEVTLSLAVEPGIQLEGDRQRLAQLLGNPTRTHSSSGVPAGTGLGLAICKLIAEAHGGGIAFESVEGEGTTFSVDLPLPPATAAAA